MTTLFCPSESQDKRTPMNWRCIDLCKELFSSSHSSCHVMRELSSTECTDIHHIEHLLTYNVFMFRRCETKYESRSLYSNIVEIVHKFSPDFNNTPHASLRCGIHNSFLNDFTPRNCYLLVKFDRSNLFQQTL